MSLFVQVSGSKLSCNILTLDAAAAATALDIIVFCLHVVNEFTLFQVRGFFVQVQLQRLILFLDFTKILFEQLKFFCRSRNKFDLLLRCTGLFL